MIRADFIRAWIVARMCGATVQDQVETPAAVRIRALGTDPRNQPVLDAYGVISY